MTTQVDEIFPFLCLAVDAWKNNKCDLVFSASNW
jgi:hypothetical protein